MHNRRKMDGPSATDLMAINIFSMSERVFRLTVARLQKAMHDQTKLIRAELKATRDDIHNVKAELKPLGMMFTMLSISSNLI